MPSNDDDIEMRYDQAAITPFWNKLPFFFLFPFRFGPVIFLACLVGASALAGLALGSFSLVFKGFLVYLGLRYAFNVLELFARGRFEGESPDHRLWGPEKRPAKLGAVLALFIVLGANIGNIALGNRLASDERTQERVIARYQQAHAAELAQLATAQAEYERRVAEHKAAVAQERRAARAAARAGATDEDGQPVAAIPVEAFMEADVPERPQAGPTREEMLQAAAPQFGDAFWFSLQPAWFWLFMALVSLLLPSAALTIALEDNLLRALNPMNVLHYMQAMGRAYLVLWAFFLAIAGSRQAALALGQDWPAALRFPLEMGIAAYLGLVLFAIMGYALYQYHQELRLDVDVDFDKHRAAGGAEGIANAGSARAAVQRSATPADPWEEKLQALVAQRNFREAIAEVRDRMRYDRYDVPLNQRLHALHLQQGDHPATLAHGQHFLTALARAGGKGREMVDVLCKLRQLQPDFVPEDGDVVLPAATAAFQQRDVGLTTSLLRAFDKRFPKHKDTAGVFFLGARVLSEQNRQHDKAARLLRTVLQHFPDDAIAAEARTYLLVLEKILAQPQAAG